MIEVERLTKDYGTVVAVRDVTFSVGRGRSWAFWPERGRQEHDAADSGRLFGSDIGQGARERA